MMGDPTGRNFWELKSASPVDNFALNIAKGLAKQYIYDPEKKRILPNSMIYPENRQIYDPATGKVNVQNLIAMGSMVGAVTPTRTFPSGILPDVNPTFKIGKMQPETPLAQTEGLSRNLMPGKQYMMGNNELSALRKANYPQAAGADDLLTKEYAARMTPDETTAMRLKLNGASEQQIIDATNADAYAKVMRRVQGQGYVPDFENAINAKNQKQAWQAIQEMIDLGDKPQAEMAQKMYERTFGSMQAAPQTGEVKLYHGSKAEFDKFDITRFGTGEGGDKFGKGAYLTDSRKLADFYANAVAKKDFVDRYTNTGILGTPEPIYKPNADQLAKQNAKVNEFIAKDLKILDADTYKVGKEEINALAKAYEDRGYSGADALAEVQRKLNFARNNSEKINNYRGELEYLIDHVASGDSKAVNRVIDIIKKKGYEGIKYASDKTYEGKGGYNYVIYNPEKLIKAAGR